MDLLTSEHNLIEAKRAYLKFTYKKKCLKCDMPIADKVNIFIYINSFLLYILMLMYFISHAPRVTQLQYVQKLIKIFKKLLNTDQ